MIMPEALDMAAEFAKNFPELRKAGILSVNDHIQMFPEAFKQLFSEYGFSTTEDRVGDSIWHYYSAEYNGMKVSACEPV